MNKQIEVSEQDKNHLAIIRENVSAFINYCSRQYDCENTVLLDVAPQIYLGAKEFFKKSIIKTLDIDPKTNPDYTADICCTNNEIIPDSAFDYVLCTEVLEHTLNPFNAVNEIYRILKPGGYIFVSVPFNFRIHGPLPDCWRFTEYGIRSLLSGFTDISIKQINTEGRDLMPVHYTVIAKK